MAIGDICNRDVVVMDKQGSVQEAAKLMRDFHVGNIVITEDHPGRRVPVGILTDRDIVVETLAENVDPASLMVADIMSYDLLTAREDDEMLDTIRAMRAHGVRRIPVINREGALEGIVSVDDLLDIVAEQLAELVELFKHEQQQERRKRA